MDQINMNQPVYLQVVERVKMYPYGASRHDIAQDFGVQKSTATEHLEKAVRQKLLVKFYGWVKRGSRGWVYIDPASAPRAELRDVMDEPEWEREEFQDFQEAVDRLDADPGDTEAQAMFEYYQHMITVAEEEHRRVYVEDDLPF
jgi:hypothetical protein